MNNIKTKIKAIIFDMDGTIINTEHLWRKATVNLLAENGITELTEKDLKILNTLSGVGLPKSSKILKDAFKIEKNIEQIMERKLELSQQLFAQNIEFIEGFATFHAKLQQNQISTSVATNADLKTLNFIDNVLNLKSFFGQNLYSMEHVGNKLKPDPAVFLHAADKLKAKPEECVVFEDSLYGFQAAKEAGIKCIAIKNDLNKNFLNNVDFSISNYHQAEEILKEIAAKKLKS